MAVLALAVAAGCDSKKGSRHDFGYRLDKFGHYGCSRS